MNALRKLKRSLQRGQLTFGLHEALIISLLAIAIAIAAAVHYSN